MISYFDMLSAVRYRWRLVLVIAAAIFTVCLVWTLLTPRSYTAAARVLVDRAAPNPGGGTTGPDNALLGTQADIINSRATAVEVVGMLNLDRDPDTIDRWRTATGGDRPIAEWLADTLLAGLSVAPETGTNVLSLQYQSTDPQFAAAMANGFSRAFLSTSLRMRTDPAKAYVRWFEDQKAAARRTLEDAQGKLANFQRENGIIDQGSLQTETSRLAQLSGQLASAEAEAAEIGTRAAGGGAAPEVQNSGVVQQLRNAIAAQQSEVNQLAVTLGPNNSQMKAARARLGTLQAKLGSETGAASGSVRVASNAAGAKEAEMRRLVADQRARMVAQVAATSQLALFQRDADTAQAAYNQIVQNMNAMRMQSALPQTNLSILDTASVPMLPSSPNIPLRLVLGALLGVLLGLTAALALELLRPRVRSMDMATRLIGRPVIARIPMQVATSPRLLVHGAAT